MELVDEDMDGGETTSTARKVQRRPTVEVSTVRVSSTVHVLSGKVRFKRTAVTLSRDFCKTELFYFRFVDQ